MVDTNSVVNIIGLRWNPFEDTIYLTPKEPTSQFTYPISKRNVLQHSSKIYDPLGFITPVTVKAKLFLQELWLKKLEWDEPLPQDLEVKWHGIAQDIQSAAKVIVPRRFFAQDQVNGDQIHLYVFVGASPKAYRAVAYLSSGDQCSFVTSKSRVAPLKTLTVPQLELMAASIGSRLAHFVSAALQPRYPHLTVHLWSDSEIVLHWLNSTKSLKQFISNRVTKMKKLFPVTSWHYCPTNDNPADLLTRGIPAPHFLSSSLWQRGPSWLTVVSQWPSGNHKSQVLQ